MQACGWPVQELHAERERDCYHNGKKTVQFTNNNTMTTLDVYDTEL